MTEERVEEGKWNIDGQAAKCVKIFCAKCRLKQKVTNVMTILISQLLPSGLQYAVALIT